MWSSKWKGLTNEQQNLSVTIPGTLMRELHLDDEKDEIVEQENFVFDFPAGWCLRIEVSGFGLVDKVIIEQ